MPAIGARGPMPALPPSKPPPAPRGGGSVGAAVSRVAKASQPLQLASSAKPRGGSDALSSGPGYGSARANAYKAGPGYHQAVKAVFQRQAPKQQAAILKNVLSGKADGPTAAAIRDGYHSLPAPRQAAAEALMLPKGAKGLNLGIGNALAKVIANLGAGIGDYGQKGAPSTAGAAKLPVSGGTIRGIGTVLPFGGSAGGKVLLENFGKDAANFVPQSISSAGVIAKDFLTNNSFKAVGDVVNPIEQFAKNPYRSFVNHPGYTGAMVWGGVNGLTRLAAAPARAINPEGAFGTAREGIQLHGNATHERPRASPYPIIKGGQVLAEKMKYKRAPTGELVPKDPNLHAKLAKGEASSLVGINERMRVVDRGGVVKARTQAINKGDTKLGQLAGKAEHGVKTALKKDPNTDTARGADVAALIADGTIRRPDTFHADLAKRMKAVSAERPNLLDNKKLLAEHDANIAKLVKVQHANLSAGEIAHLFRAAASYEKDYHPTQDAAASFGHFGRASKDALLKRELAHYAVAHMGAEYGKTEGELVIPSDKPVDGNLVRLHTNMMKSYLADAQREGLTSAAGKRALANAELERQHIEKLSNPGKTGVRPLSTSEIIAHTKGPEGLGGRKLAFTSDRPPRGSAFYVPSDRMPLPARAKNTLFAYTHGLTDPSHNALLEQHVRMQGIVSAHKAIARIIHTHVVMRKDGSAWPSYEAAQSDASGSLVPFALSQPFHKLDSLDQALHGTNPATIEEEAQAHSLDIASRLHDSGQGRWGLIDKNVADRINEHRAQVISNTTQRLFKMGNNQFRKVALGTSVKHLPGLLQEQLIRDASSATGFSSWVTGKRIMAAQERLDPEAAKLSRVALGGGNIVDATRAAVTHTTSQHFFGTNLYRPLRTFEEFLKYPGPRQAATAWRAWLRVVLNGTKHVLSEQHHAADLGKAVLRDFGSEHGPMFKAMRLQGQMLDDAARKTFDPVKQRQLRAEIEQVRGRFTDLTPAGQAAMMYSPFGLWLVNSAKWLARGPIDRPVQTGVVGDINTGTEKERKALGMDFFAPHPLPLYKQGGIPLPNGKILGANYYSPMGIANDPLETGSQLIEPWLQNMFFGAAGDNWLGKSRTSKTDPHGHKQANLLSSAEYIANGFLSSFLPVYTKAEMVAQGGASAYDDSSLAFGIDTKTPGKGIGAGLKKALLPVRISSGQQGATGTASTAGNTYNLPNAGGNTYNLPSTAGNTYNLPSGGGGGNTYNLP